MFLFEIGVGVRAPQHTLLTVLWCFLSDEWWWRHECSWGETVPTPMDFRNNLALRFGFLPSGLPTRCYGCGAPVRRGTRHHGVGRRPRSLGVFSPGVGGQGPRLGGGGI